MTHYVYNYKLCVKFHTVCKITHCVENLHCVKFCVNCQKIPLAWIFYTTAGSGGSDYYEVCSYLQIWNWLTDPVKKAKNMKTRSNVCM